MEYIDYEYYKDDYEGEEVSKEDFPRLVKRASEAIDQMTNYQIPKIGFDNFADHVQELIKKATAAQVEYFETNGLEVNVNGSSEGDNFSVGKFTSKNTNKVSRQSGRFSPAAIGFLSGTGLIRKNGVSMRVI